MTTLAKDQPRSFYEGHFHAHPVIAADIIYQGAAVGDNGAGYARPLVAGDPFRGFADQQADNSTGSAGDVDVTVRKEGFIKLPIASLAITDVGKDVYASDDNTFTLTASGNTRIGYVSSWISSGYGIIRFNAANGAEALLTDSSGGTANNTIVAVSGSGADAAINDNFADLAAKVNYLLQAKGS